MFEVNCRRCNDISRDGISKLRKWRHQTQNAAQNSFPFWVPLQSHVLNTRCWNVLWASPFLKVSFWPDLGLCCWLYFTFCSGLFPCNHFSRTEWSLWSQPSDLRADALLFSQLKKDAKCCHSPLTMSQPLHACGRGAEKEEFGDIFLWRFIYLGYIFGIIFKPLRIPGLVECGFGPQLISGLGEKWRRKWVVWKGLWGEIRWILRSSNDLVTEETSSYAHKIRTN